MVQEMLDPHLPLLHLHLFQEILQNNNLEIQHMPLFLLYDAKD
jgi:hypothetical protein